MGEVDLRRMERAGVRPLSVTEGLALFDAGVTSDEAVLVPARLTQARSAARALARRAGAAGGLEERLAVLDAGERLSVLSDLVRGEVAGVLGFADGSAVDVRRQFQD
ncbi:acyl carrier protein, partial [Sphaerisporangium melleum]|uniref:acyl carrier protein n=1 Tax=Sphaerisporangium melleum TaxID=321316 RepID=UPI001E5D4F6C